MFYYFVHQHAVVYDRWPVGCSPDAGFAITRRWWWDNQTLVVM